MRLTATQIGKIVGGRHKAPIVEGFVKGFNSRMSNRPALEGCHFVAQVAHECDRFNTTTEYASGKAYEGRKDLGNTRPGDGMRFKGRGLIQTTGRTNTELFFAWLRRNHPELATAADDDPMALSEFPYAFLSALFYWDSRGCAKYAMRNDIKALTKSINGGYNGLSDRTTLFVRTALVVMGYNMTKGVVARFQRDRGIKVDDIAGEETLNELALALIDMDHAIVEPQPPMPTPEKPDTSPQPEVALPEITPSPEPVSGDIWKAGFNVGPWWIGITIRRNK